MTTTSTGRQAEDTAADYLKSKKYKILNQNWHTRWCEIDIVAKKKAVVYFVEVKYRKSADFGAGLSYITDKKLKQMHLSARFWVSENNWSGDYRLSAIEVTGDDYKITEHISSIDYSL